MTTGNSNPSSQPVQQISLIRNTTYSINEVTPIPADTKKACNGEKPLEPTSTATSSTCANSNGPDMLSDADGEKYLAHQSYLRSYGRPDVRREPRRFLGWTLARWLLLITTSLVRKIYDPEKK